MTDYPYRDRWQVPPNVPVSLDEIDPDGDVALVDFGLDAYCSICGPESSPRQRTDLWAVRQQTVEHYAGPVWKYCREHLPEREWQHGSDGKANRVREVVCPECFMITPVGSICEATGQPH